MRFEKRDIIKMLEEVPIENVGEKLLETVAIETRKILNSTKNQMNCMVKGILYFQMQFEDHKELFAIFDENKSDEFMKIANSKFSLSKLKDYFDKLNDLNKEIEETKQYLIKQLDKI